MNIRLRMGLRRHALYAIEVGGRRCAYRSADVRADDGWHANSIWCRGTDAGGDPILPGRTAVGSSGILARRLLEAGICEYDRNLMVIFQGTTIIPDVGDE